MKKLSYLAIGLLLLGACRSSPKPSRSAAVWENASDIVKRTEPRVIEMLTNNQLKIYYTGSIYALYEYKSVNDTIWILKDNQWLPHAATSAQDTLYWLQTEAAPLAFTSVDKPRFPQEKNIADVIPALQGATVQARLENIIQAFAPGDYATTETLYYLIGISPQPYPGEPEDVALQRYVVGNMRKLTKYKKGYGIELASNQTFEATLPLYERQNGERVLKGSLDIEISPDAFAYVAKTKKGVRINIQGVKLGKGFLKVGLPPLVVEGDYGRILGIRFYLAR